MRNRGELAEGWYDPATLRHAQISIDKAPCVAKTRQAKRGSPDYRIGVLAEEGSSEDDMFGPRIPQRGGEILGKKSGPSIPNRQDLDLQRGTSIFLVAEFLSSIYVPPHTDSMLIASHQLTCCRARSRKLSRETTRIASRPHVRTQEAQRTA